MCHFFIASHLPLDVKATPADVQMRKSAMKQKDYTIRLSEVTELKEKDFFSSEITRAQLKKRKDHIDKILSDQSEGVKTRKQYEDSQLLEMAMPEKV